MNTIAFILARAGSKGLPGKNTKRLAGKPLINWTIEAGLNCRDIDHVIVSTDGEEIADIAEKAGATVLMRPSELATDTAMPKDAIRYHLKTIEQTSGLPDCVALLQPTSPLRPASFVSACLSYLRTDQAESAATFQVSPTSPYQSWKESPAGIEPFIDGFDPWQPRQSLPKTFSLNGAVYACKTKDFLNDQGQSFLPGRRQMVLMPEILSIDIDTELDFMLAERVLESESYLKAVEAAG